MTKPTLITLGILIGLATALTLSHSAVQAATTSWLWGGTPSADGAYQGTGWIDASAVTVPAGDANLSGYAWTPYYGWLSFEAADLSGCPSGTCAAYRQGSAIKGWAKFLALGTNGTATNGWVSLSGTGYGIDTSAPYAWSDDLGWIDIAGLMSAVPTVNIQFQ